MQNLGIDSIIKAFPRLLEGFALTIQISAIALVLSIILGFIAGVIMTSRNKLITVVSRVLLEAFRLIHPIIWLFIFFFGITYVFHVPTDNIVVSIVVFTLWGTFELGDIVRSFIKSLPKSQFESSQALGLSKLQMYIYILLPQVVLRTIPSVVNLATRLIKTTTLVFLIGVPEMLKVSQNIIQVVYYNNPNSKISFTMYLTLLLIYFIICYPLSLFSRYLEKRISI
jgi:amine acid ABC transporter, permease protein, 3-TM region, His/Glu/Gln/Arg/opine family